MYNHLKFICSIDVAKLFTLIEFNSNEPRFGCSLVPWTWWALQNWTFKGKVMNGSRFSWDNFLFWFFPKWTFWKNPNNNDGWELSYWSLLLLARALSLVKRLPFLLARWRELCDWLKFRRLMIVDWRELCHWSVNFVINGDFRLNKGFTHGKFFVHPLVNLCLNVQFWSAHHVHGTKLHPKRGSCDMNSIEVKSFEIPNVVVRVKIGLLLPSSQHFIDALSLRCALLGRNFRITATAFPLCPLA